MKADSINIRTPSTSASTAPPNFDRLSRLYRWMEWLTFGPSLQRTRCTFLPSLRQHRRALILGDGDGRFTAALISANPRITIDAVDASASMLRQLAARAASNRVHIHIADARTLQPVRRDYDLIVTHFFLDCLTTAEVANLASRLRRHACDSATWVISEFAIPANLYGRLIARPLISALYVAFGLLTSLTIRTLPDHRTALAESGWTLAHQHRTLGGLLVSELWRLEPKP